MKHSSLPVPAEYEYESLPAPTKAERRPGLKTDGERLAFSIAEILNEMSEDGWEYVRSDTFSTESWTDISGTGAKSQTILIFRRLMDYTPVAADDTKAASKPLLLTEPTLPPGQIPLPSNW